MQAIHGRLLELVRKLDKLGPAPTLVDLAEAMHTTRLAREDVEPFIQRNPHSYNRATVIANEHYEVLVMTWLPGQSSVPHDHAGSICVMQVITGEATEGSFRADADGYVALDYETIVRTGEITSGQDAGVHTVRNDSQSGEPLVTVHIYAPPLRDFRRFVARPGASQNAAPANADAIPTIVIVGGGFSGSMTAAQILRQAKSARVSGVRVVVIERRGAIGEGLAYSTREPAHLLNVPAGRMSAWPDRPVDFVNWASRRYGQVDPKQFLPRQWYGEYVRETLLDTSQAAGDSAELKVLLDEVRRIARRPAGGWMIHLATGASLNADAVVLAIGHRPPSDPLAKYWNGPRTRFIADPWRPFAMNVVQDGEHVVVLGSGLTAVDAVMSLASRGKTNISVVSRNGLLPQAHLPQPLPPTDMQPVVSELLAAPGGVTARGVLRALRGTVRELAKSGTDWRSVLDGLRPHTATLWQAMSSAERKRFFVRLRPFWEIHRHRMAVAVGEQFNALRARKEIRTIAARVVSAHADNERVRLIFGERKTGRLLEVDAGWVVNCTGPAPSNSAASNPAIGSLLVQGYLRPDELGLGIETATDGNAIDREGHEVADLFIVGTLRKPALWESTAVPELRQQAAIVGQHALTLVAPPVVASVRPNFIYVPMPVRS